MESQSENIIYKLPGTPSLAEYLFKKISITIEGDSRPQPASWTKKLILPRNTENSFLTFCISGISSSKYPRPQKPDLIIALYKRGISDCILCNIISCDESSCHGSISLADMDSGEYFLYIGNAKPGRDISIMSYERMGAGVAFNFTLMDNGTHYHLPEIQQFCIFCYHTIRLSFKTPINPTNSWISYEYSRWGDDTVVSSHWLEISSDGMYINMGSRPNVEFIDGEYRLKIFYNNDLKAHIHFKLKDFEVTEYVQESI